MLFGIQIIKNESNRKLYIAEKNIKANIIIAVPKNSFLLKKQIIKIKSLHLINSKEKISSNLKVRIRHLGSLYNGRLIKKNNSYYFSFNKPIEAVAEGQYIVLYDGNKVVGSGEIRL